MRPLNLTAKLKDTANASIPQLSFQRKAVQDYRSRPSEVSQPALAESTNDPPSSSLTLEAHTTSTLQAKRSFSSITSDAGPSLPDKHNNTNSVNELEVADDSERVRKKGMYCLIYCTVSNQCPYVFPVKVTQTTLGNPVAVDSDGLLMDVDVQPIDDSQPTREEKRQDVDQFFCIAVVKDVNGKSKKYCTCKICPWAFFFTCVRGACKDWCGSIETTKVSLMK